MRSLIEIKCLFCEPTTMYDRCIVIYSQSFSHATTNSPFGYYMWCWTIHQIGVQASKFPMVCHAREHVRSHFVQPQPLKLNDIEFQTPDTNWTTLFTQKLSISRNTALATCCSSDAETKDLIIVTTFSATNCRIESFVLLPFLQIQWLLDLWTIIFSSKLHDSSWMNGIV